METATAGDWSQIILYQRERGEESISERVRKESSKRFPFSMIFLLRFSITCKFMKKKNFLREAITYASDVL